MYGPIGCLLSFFLFVLVFIVVVCVMVVQKVRDTLSSLHRNNPGRPDARFFRQDERFGNPPASEKGKRKVFDDNEGEYVDYEEIE